MRTNEEVKQLCIKELEKLIQNIKDDKTSDNYTYSVDVLERTSMAEMTTGLVRYAITRNEYFFKTD